jgi:8-amino-7-oxononanoate synthase
LSFADRIRSELRGMEIRAQLRSLELSGGVNLCSNDYLGLAADSRLKQAVLEGVERSAKMGSTGSRLLSGNAREWQDLEEEFAAFAGTPAALYFSSGYAANLGLLSCLLQPRDVVFSDSLNHASIIDGIRLSGARKVIYPHCDVGALAKQLAACRDENGCKLIVTETVFSMDGDRAPVSELLALAQVYGADLILDEAHATGVHGPQGRGLAADAGMVSEVLAVVHTCGKALASMGAFVCSGTRLKEFLINRARPFIFSTAMPPYVAHQIRAALQIVQNADQERAQLHSLSHRFRRLLRERGFDTGLSASQIVPIILGDNETALHFAAQLRRSGYAVRAIRPPSVRPGTSRLRLSLTSQLTNDQLDGVVAALLEARRSLPVVSHA